MSRWFKNPFTIIGLLLVLFGWSPLLSIIFLDTLGLWPDPNPNPIGPGLLFFFTGMPAVICLLLGIIISLAHPQQASIAPSTSQPSPLPGPKLGLTDNPTTITPAHLTSEQQAYIDSPSWAASFGLAYFIFMGTPETFFRHLIPNLNYIHYIQHGRQQAWRARHWPTFDQFKTKNDQLDQLAKTTISIITTLAIIFFTFITLI